MKVKILKKVRKRFKIIHMPDGLISMNTHYRYNLYMLEDSTDDRWSRKYYAQLGEKNRW